MRCSSNRPAQAAPFEIPVAALPLVVEDAPALRDGGPPAEMQAEQRGLRRLDANWHAACVRFGLHGDAGAVPSAAFAGERKWAAFEEGDGEVGQAQDIDIAINGAHGLRISSGRQAGREGQQVAAGEDWWVHESIVSGDAQAKSGQLGSAVPRHLYIPIIRNNGPQPTRTSRASASRNSKAFQWYNSPQQGCCACPATAFCRPPGLI